MLAGYTIQAPGDRGFSIKDSLMDGVNIWKVRGGGEFCGKHGLYGLYNLFGDCPHGDTWSFSSAYNPHDSIG